MGRGKVEKSKVAFSGAQWDGESMIPFASIYMLVLFSIIIWFSLSLGWAVLLNR